MLSDLEGAELVSPPASPWPDSARRSVSAQGIRITLATASVLLSALLVSAARWTDAPRGWPLETLCAQVALLKMEAWQINLAPHPAEMAFP